MSSGMPKNRVDARVSELGEPRLLNRAWNKLWLLEGSDGMDLRLFFPMGWTSLCSIHCFTLLILPE